jgi:hypothetical protein
MDRSGGIDPVDEEKAVCHGPHSPVFKAGTSTVIRIPDDGSNNARPRGFLAKLIHYENVLDAKLGVEKQSLERKAPELRDPNFKTGTKQALMFLIWISSCSNLCCFATGFIGYEFGLDLKSFLLIMIFGNTLGCLLPVSSLLTPIECS